MGLAYPVRQTDAKIKPDPLYYLDHFTRRSLPSSIWKEAALSHDYELYLWEDEARTIVTQLLKQAEFDDVRGTLWMPDYNVDKRDLGIEFHSLEGLSKYLSDSYDAVWHTYVPFEKGNPVFEGDSTGYVSDTLVDRPQFESFFDRHAAATEETIVTADQLLLPNAEASRVVRISMEETNAELVKYLAANPEKMRELSPRKFEELVADMWRNQGFDVTLTNRTRDGGMDVIAVQKSGVGTLMFIVECKRYAAHNKVGVEVVRGLYGVVEQKRATQGIIATTSYFTKGVTDFRNDIPYRIGLADFDQLKSQIQEWKVRNDG